MTEHADRLAPAQIEAVTRTVSATPTTDGAAVVATLSQVFPTTADDLWRACTDPDRLTRWFAPVSGTLEQGGRYQIEGNASGTVESCDPPRSFTLTWEFGGAVTWVDVAIEAVDDDEARLDLTHRGDQPQDFWSTYGPGATGVGWDLGLLGLALHLIDGAARPPETEEWMHSPTARQFIADSSTAWADAWIAGGGHEPDARAAAERTTAFYTGQEPPAPQ